MKQFIKDSGIPSHGRRTKADNAGSVRVRITTRRGIYPIDNLEYWSFYLNVRPGEGIYNATAEAEYIFPRKRLVRSVTIPSEAICELVRLSGDNTFMSIRNKHITPQICVLDGEDITLSIKTGQGAMMLEGKYLMQTLRDGIITAGNASFKTPFHKFATITYEALGINRDECQEELEDNEMR